MSEADKVDLAAAEGRAAEKAAEKAKDEEQLDNLASMMSASVPTFSGWTPPSFADFEEEKEEDDRGRKKKEKLPQPSPPPPPSAGIK